jgi:two-component system nitrate/nitrite response regulator NarL
MDVSTVVIEPRFLLREALISLLSSKGYSTIGGAGSMADVKNTLQLADAPRLVILGPQPADQVASAVVTIRKLWRDAKVVLLLDQASSTRDSSQLLASEIDGCIPLLASPDDLVDALERILLAGDFRVLIFKAERCSSSPCPTGKHESEHTLALIPNAQTRNDGMTTGTVDRTSSVRVTHGFSPRQEAILIGLTKGYSNKMIARTCGITEATIKVHMKSVLQKIRASNRTQAAVWALAKGYGADTHVAAAA